MCELLVPRPGVHAGTGNRWPCAANVRRRAGRVMRVVRAIAVGILLGATLSGAAWGQEGEERVAEVRIVGNQTVPASQILSQIRTRAGRPFDLEMVRSDVRTLATSGSFVDVKSFHEHEPAGRVVIFRVVERPSLRWVKYLGNQSVKDKTLAKETGLQVGDAVDPYAVEEGRRKILAYYKSHGFPQASVTIFEGNRTGDLGATYVVSEGQRQRIRWVRFIGNKIVSDARLRTQIKSKPPIAWLFRGYVERETIDEDVQRLTEYYRSLGYFRAKVGRELLFNDARSWLTLQFVIHEGPRYQVRDVSFVGNRTFASENLTHDLDLAPGTYFNQAKMDHDLAQLREFYGSRGYVFADVQADPRFLEEPGYLDLVYRVEEGRRFRAGEITVKIRGENPHTKVDTVLNRISIQPGDVLDIRKIRGDERRLRASQLFADRRTGGAGPRYVFGQPELSAADVARESKPRVNIRGQSPDQPHRWMAPAEATRRAATRPARAATLPRAQPEVGGQRVDAAGRLVRGQDPGGYPWPAPPVPRTPRNTAGSYGTQPLGRLGPGAEARTRQTAVSPSPQTVYQPPATPPPGGLPSNTSVPVGPGAAPFQLFPNGQFSPIGPPALDPTLPLEVQVEETQTGRFMLGVGVNSDAGLVGSVVLDERNFDIHRWPTSLRDFADGTAFRGAGQRFRLELLPGSEVQRYLVNFQEPYLWDTPISLGLSGFYYDRRFVDWDEQRVGGRVSLGYQLTPDLSGSVSYRGENVNIHDPRVPTPPEVQEVLGDNVLHGFRLALTHDTRDSPFLATEGHYIELGAEQVVGSFDYPRATGDFRQYFLVHQRPDSSGRHVLGLSSRVGFSGTNTPVYDHFFAGGFSTLRGFDFRGASPRNMGVTVGGEFMWINSAEYLLPITADDMLRGVVFCDFGTVEPRVDLESFRVSPGLGLRVTVPALGPAPIALDFAFPVAKAVGDDTQVFSFSIGIQR